MDANTEPCATPNAIFDIEELQFLIHTKIRQTDTGLHIPN